MNLPEIMSHITHEPYFIDTNSAGEVIGVLYCADCLEILPQVPEGCVDLVLTDPKYNVGKDYGDKVDDNDRNYDIWVANICSLVRTVSPMFCIYAPNKFYGLWSYNLPGGWPIGLINTPTGAIRNNWINKMSLLWTNIRPVKPTQNYWMDIILRSSGYYFTEETYGHPGYTPPKLLSRIIGLTPEDTVVIADPQNGTGTTCVCAKRHNRHYIGIEIEERYCAIAKQRLLQMELF